MRTNQWITGLAGALALSVSACAPGEAEETGTVAQAIIAVCPAGQMLEGLDVSYAQGPIDWTMVRGSGREFAYARATGGVTVDDRFGENWPAMRAAGIVRGAYHFFHPTQDPIAQADLFIRTVGHLADNDLPPMLDVETYTRRAADGTIETIPADEVAAAARRWIDRVQAALGRIPVVYTATFIWSSHIHSPDFSENPLWIADWHEECPRVPAPWTTWAIHQYSPGPDAPHSIPGIDRAVVDHDHFNGGRAALDRFILRSFVVRPAGVADGGAADASASDAGRDDASADDALEPADGGGVTDAGTPNGDGASDDASENEPDASTAMPHDPNVGTRVAGCSVGGATHGSGHSSARSFALAAVAAAVLARRIRRRRVV